MTEKQEPSKKKGPIYPEIESACLVCHGHGHEILEDLTYCRCRRCLGSGVDPKDSGPKVPADAFISVDERRKRMNALAVKRVAERTQEETKPDSPSHGHDGMSDLEC